MKYLRIQLKNTEPLRISDDSVSQNGQTDTLTYIPGSALRGALIKEMEKRADFEELINEFLSEKVCFLNSYPSYVCSDEIKELIPSIKGFYEDKQEVTGKKPIESVLHTGIVEEGKKRAGIGRYCYPDGDTINYLADFNLGADLKINIGRDEGVKKNVFRIQYIPAGKYFTGYIRIEGDGLFNVIKEALDKIRSNDSLYFGNGRWSGLGHTKIIDVTECDTFGAETFAESGILKSPQYLMLLSHGTMLNEYGENTGIDIPTLEKMLDVKNLKVSLASSSVINVHGFNRTWKTRTPSVKMYEMGSMFKLTYDGEITDDRVEKLYLEGIGIRKNEGFGRVIFVKDYEKLAYKKAFKINAKSSSDEAKKDIDLSHDDKSTLKVVARGLMKKRLMNALRNYIEERPLKMGNVNRSQLGAIRSISAMYLFKPEEAMQQLKDYMIHSEEKAENQKVHSSPRNIKALNDQIRNIIDTDSHVLLFGTKDTKPILGLPVKEIFTKDEWLQFRIQTLLEMIDQSNRRDKYDA